MGLPRKRITLARLKKIIAESHGIPHGLELKWIKKMKTVRYPSGDTGKIGSVLASAPGFRTRKLMVQADHDSIRMSNNPPRPARSERTISTTGKPLSQAQIVNRAHELAIVEDLRHLLKRLHSDELEWDQLKAEELLYHQLPEYKFGTREAGCRKEARELAIKERGKYIKRTPEKQREYFIKKAKEAEEKGYEPYEYDTFVELADEIKPTKLKRKGRKKLNPGLSFHERMGRASHLRSAFPGDPRCVIHEETLSGNKQKRLQRAEWLERAQQAARRGDTAEFNAFLALADEIKPITNFMRRDLRKMLFKRRKKLGMIPGSALGFIKDRRRHKRIGGRRHKRRKRAKTKNTAYRSRTRRKRRPGRSRRRKLPPRDRYGRFKRVSRKRRRRSNRRKRR